MKLSRALWISVAAVVGFMGCSSSSDEEEPTYAKTIEPLVQEKCQGCHRAGGIAPFTLDTFQDVKRVGGIAREKVLSREMPPWGAHDDATCQMQHKFKDDLRLTDAQVDQFVKWIDRGMPMGDESQRPPPRTVFPATNLADKTHTFALAKPHEVVGGGPDDIRCFPIDPGFKEDTWVGGWNVVPGDPRVVHHVIVYVDPDAEGVKKVDASGSYPCFGGPGTPKPALLVAWAPGVPPSSYPEASGLKVPAGAHLVTQVHYHPTQNTVLDQTAFELKILPYKPGYVVQIILLGNARSATGAIKLLPGPNDPPSGPEFLIPANVPDHIESMEVTIPAKIQNIDIPQQQLLAAGSHMHWAGVDLKIDIERANGYEGQPAKECLLGTPKYDFNWQRAYAYDEPLEKLPSVGPGDKLRFTCKYNNTMSNRHVHRAMSEQRLPGPVHIGLGESTLEEMCLGALVTVRRATLLD
jgi:hypothetical protein